MSLDWRTIDRWLIGEAWTGSHIEAHVAELCANIGPRWSSSEAEQGAVGYIREQMAADGLDKALQEEYDLETWKWTKAEATIVEDGIPIDILPFNRCPAFAVAGSTGRSPVTGPKRSELRHQFHWQPRRRRHRGVGSHGSLARLIWQMN